MMNLNECLLAEKDKEIAYLRDELKRLKRQAELLYDSYAEEYNHRRKSEYTPKTEIELVLRRISIYLLNGLMETQTNSEAG